MATMHLYDANGNFLWLTETKHFNDEEEAAWAQQICAEQGDGLLVLHPQTREVRIVNRDGSDGQFCGNGLQATAFHIGQEKVQLHMGGRQIEARVEKPFVSVFLEASIQAPHPVIWQRVQAYALHMPNPHWVFLEPPSDWQLDQEGQACCLEKHTNVEWVWSEGKMWRVAVYERGAGITAACGSGALAVFAVLRALGHVQNQAEIKMPGGILTVTAIGSKLSLRGQVRLLQSRVV